MKPLYILTFLYSPGEALPIMPMPTHNEGGSHGLKAFNTVNRVIDQINANPRSDPDFRSYAQDRRRPPYDGDKPLTSTITTHGPDSKGVPSGIRPFTIRELAALQGFPPNHTFAGSTTQKTKQIGNAVPPIVAKTLFTSIVNELKLRDGVVEPDHIIIED